MSYEGYSQFLCKNGHRWSVDCHELMYCELEDYPKCPKCGEPAVWENMVNLTNGSHDEDGNRIDGFVELEVRAEMSGKCDCCGGTHVCERVYEVPAGDEDELD